MLQEGKCRIGMVRERYQEEVCGDVPSSDLVGA
jgi:hypothetical protein